MQLGFRSGPPRRAPYPGDLKVEDMIAMLGIPAGVDGKPREGARLISTKPGDLDKVSPTDYGYSALSPLFERVQVYADLELGYGQRIQLGERDRRYRYAINADLSVAGIMMKGPLITTGTPGTRDSTVGITRAVEINSAIYFANGQYALLRASDSSLTVAKDFGTGKSCTDAIVFYSNMAGGAKYAYFAMGDSEAVWRAGPKFEQQTITISGTPTGGTYSIQWGSYSSQPVAYNASAATLQSALRAIPGLSAIEVSSTGSSPNFTHTVTFTGVTTDPAEFTSTSALTGGTPGIAHATTVAFTAVEWLQRVEVQTVVISGTPTGGTFTLHYGNLSTSALAYDVGAAAMQTALRLLSGLSSVEVTATGTSPDLTYTITFTGVGTNAIQLTSTNALTGGATPTVTHATTKEPLFARAWAIRGREFYRASNTNEVAKVNTDSDPFLEENWTDANAFTAGDKTAGIVRMAINALGELRIFKTDGIYVLDEAGDDTNLFPELRLANDSTNGEALGNWLNDMFVTYGGGLYQLQPNNAMGQVGPEVMTANDSDVKGKITAVCGHDTYNLYAGLYNPDNGDSYLMKYGGWIIPPDGAPQRVDAWHGSISVAYTDKKMTLLHKSAIGAATGYTRMWIGFSDGTYAYFILPITPNPAASTSYTFSTANGEVYMPTFHGIFRSDPKNYRAITITSQNASATNYAQAEFRTDPTNPYTAVGEDFNSPQKERIALPTTASGRIFEMKVILINTASSASPLLTSVGLHYQIRPALFLLHDFYVLAEDGVRMRNGVPMKIGAKRIRDLVKGFVGSTANPTMVFPDQTSIDCAFVNYEETVAWDRVERKWRASLHIQAVEIVLTSRGTYGRMELYTYGALEGYTYGQLEQI